MTPELLGEKTLAENLRFAVNDIHIPTNQVLDLVRGDVNVIHGKPEVLCKCLLSEQSAANPEGSTRPPNKSDVLPSTLSPTAYIVTFLPMKLRA